MIKHVVSSVKYSPISEKEFTIYVDERFVAMILRGHPSDLDYISERIKEVFNYED